MNFGELMKEKRYIERLSQKDLADKLGTTQKIVTDWETGKTKPSGRFMIDVLDILNITVEEAKEAMEWEA